MDYTTGVACEGQGIGVYGETPAREGTERRKAPWRQGRRPSGIRIYHEGGHRDQSQYSPN